MTMDGLDGRDVLVLSGGGSRGAAQVGMLRALLGAGMVPDVLVGASVGALNAAFLAADATPDQVEDLADHWMRMTSRHLIGARRRALLNLATARPYLFSADRLRSLVETWVAHRRLEDLPVPLRIATTHLGTGRPVHHDEGDLAELLAASASLPGVFPPVRLPCETHGEAFHVDAGLSENVPLTGAFGLVQPGDRVWVLDVTKIPVPRAMRNPVDVLVTALSATVRGQVLAAPPAGVEMVHVKLDEAFDCGKVFDFGQTGTLFRLGEQTATAVLADRAALAS